MNIVQNPDLIAASDGSKRNLRSVFLEHAQSQGETEAILAPGRAPLTFAGLAERATEIKLQLNDVGIGRGDRIVVVLPNGPEMAVCYLAIAACAIFVPLNPDFTQSEFERYLERLNPRAVIISSDAGSTLRAACVTRELPVIELSVDEAVPAGQFTLTGAKLGDCRDPDWNQADDNILIIPTTGTTGRPKLVPTTLQCSLRSGAEMADWFGVGPGDRALHFMPMFHGHGLNSALMFPVIAGSAMMSRAVSVRWSYSVIRPRKHPA